MSTLKKSPIWVVEWTMQDWLWNLSSENAKKLTNYINQVGLALDDKDLADRLLPKLSDQPGVFASKLDNLNNSLMQELNWWRDIYWLPALTTDALNNYSERVALYRWNNTAYQSIVTPQNTWGKSIDSSINNLVSTFWIRK